MDSHKTDLCDVMERACCSGGPIVVKAYGAEVVVMTSSVLEALLYDRATLEAYRRGDRWDKEHA
ncbi:MAG: hypothetical protein RRZ85_02735 [Gordonibacter sp.]|uniref:hypothetical protein n=1 Tax=Gordonibacter sp. TaxID=1968902 RepID=UPI002FC9316C